MGAEIQNLINELSSIVGSDRLYNPYTPLDDPGATIRRSNFVRYLTDIKKLNPTILMIAEAPGYRGCVWSGIPVTSERIMKQGIAKWDLFGEGYQPTSDNPQGVAEMTATILWNVLVEHFDVPPVLWNTVPLHPHKLGNRQSNRTPTVKEQRMGAAYIEKVMLLFNFDTIMAVGRKAQKRLDELGYNYIPLRHPSQGGKAEFIRGIQQALKK